MIRAALFVLIVVFAMFAAPAEAFRCGNRIVTEGDYVDRIRHICGDPQSVQFWTEIRLRPVYSYRDRINPHVRGISLPVEIQVEEWTYNLGNRRFMRRLRFENGRLIEIRALRYGY